MPMPPPGFHVVETLYEGARTVVHRARRDADGALVVLKQLKVAHPSPHDLVRYRSEFDISRRLDGPHLVHIEQMIKHLHRLVLVEENFDGVPLVEAIPEGGLPIYTFLHLAIEVTRGLGEVHGKGVIHNDVSPTNILVNPTSLEARIIDFGLAAPLERGESGKMRPHETAGTLPYMSPEQTGRTNWGIDFRTDLYSLGMVFYQMATGGLPFGDAHDPAEWFHCHLAREPLAVNERREDFPAPLAAIIMRLLAKPPEDRYQSVHGLLVDLERCQEQWHAHGKIDAFELGERDIHATLHVSQKLYGREAQVRQLIEGFEATCDDGPRLMLIGGPTGAGKSALVTKLQGLLMAKRVWFATGRFPAGRPPAPYTALSQAFRNVVNQLLGLPPAELATWRKRVTEAVGDDAVLLGHLIPELNTLLGRLDKSEVPLGAQAHFRFCRALRRFASVFCCPHRPLTLLLTDLQRADDASLKLIETLVCDSGLKYLFVVGTYRCDDVDAAHPSDELLEALTCDRVRIDRIELSPLAIEHVEQLLADTLHAPIARIEPLARLVQAKTSGNPYFINRFLESLERESLLWFDADAGQWCWNLAEIEAANITDNVADLLLERLDELPEQTRTTLSFAALLGASFELELLARVLGQSAPQTYEQLEPALLRDIIATSVPPKIVNPQDSDSPMVVEELTFVHDRIRQAAAHLIARQDADTDGKNGAEKERLAEAHLKIGRALRTKLHDDSPPSLIFSAACHANAGSDRITAELEALEIAQINHRAGRLTMEALAFSAAQSYLRQADALIERHLTDGNSKWQGYADFTQAVALDRARAEMLAGDQPSTEAVCAHALEHISDPVDRAEFYSLLVRIRALAGDLDGAVEAARDGLVPLGVELPDDDLDDALNRRLEHVDAAMARVDVLEIPRLPKLDDPHAEAALGLLSQVEVAAGLIDFRLLQIVGLESTLLTLAIGLRPQSLSGLCEYGVALSLRARPEEGYAIGSVALGAAREFEDDAAFSHVAFIHAAIIMPWSRPLNESIGLLSEGHEAGVRSGNIPFAGWCMSACMLYRAILGEEVSEVLAQAEQAAQFGDEHGHIAMHAQAMAYIAWAHNLLGRTADASSFDTASFTSTQELLDHCGRFGLDAIHAIFGVARAQVACIYGHSDLAVEILDDIADRLDAMVGTFDTGRYLFYRALALVDTCHGLEEEQRVACRAQVEDLHDQLEALAEHCMANFGHMSLLIGAELARFDDDFRGAIDLYDRAIELAAQRDILHIEALAHERAADFWLAHGKPDFAARYLWNASRTYEAWGATRKVDQLREQWGDLLTRGQTWTGGRQAEPRVSVDITSVFKAVETLSSQLDLDDLLPTLMRVILENAGAQRGTFFLVENDQVRVAVEGSIDTQPSQPSVEIDLDHWHGGARSVVRFVERTHELVVVGRAISEPRFADDPYFEGHPAHSVLCMPVEEHGKMLGILYVENNLTDYAFTDERIRVLRILAGHISVSLNKARLYVELKEKEERFRQLAENIEEVFWLMDWPSRQIAYVSPAYEVVWGRHVPQEPMPLDQWLEPVVERHRHDVITALAEKAAAGDYDMSYQIERPSGERRWVHDRGFPIRDANGRVYRIAGVAVDITKQHEIKQMKDEFISIVSHELRTPLTPITGIFRLLAQDPDEELSERSKQMVDLGLRNSRRLLRIIDDLLDMQKLSLEKVDFDQEVLDLYEVVDDAVEINSVLGEARGVRVSLDGPSETLCVKADRSRLLQVLTNLLSNAIKFTADGTTVEVDVKRVNNRAHVSVRDQGPGIPPEARASIFEKFTQADSSMTRKYGGTGLGLTIAKSIIDRLAGRINFDSEIGEGTTFYFELPLVES